VTQSLAWGRLPYISSSAQLVVALVAFGELPGLSSNLDNDIRISHSS
jgi:hypothetical protein